MRKDKEKRMMENYNGHKGDATIAHVQSDVAAIWPGADKELTGAQYGRLMSVANNSYHAGRAGAGAELIEGAIYVPSEHIYGLPVEIAQKIEIKHKRSEPRFESAGVMRDGGGLSSRGACNDYWVMRLGTYERVPRSGIRDGEEAYHMDQDEISIVFYDGKEVARYTRYV